jgi:hypothetical protein
MPLHNAVAVANSSASAANVTVTQGMTTIITTAVQAGGASVIEPWVDAL